MWAMIVKEFRQLRRDRRTLAMMIVLPVLLLVVFGCAASFDVTVIPVAVAGPGAAGLDLRALGRVPAQVSEAPATLEERFFERTAAARGAGDRAPAPKEGA